MTEYRADCRLHPPYALLSPLRELLPQVILLLLVPRKDVDLGNYWIGDNRLRANAGSRIAALKPRMDANGRE